jgi:hypothetical protein
MPVKGDFNVPLRDFQKLIELREILERGVSRLAAMNITEEQIRDLERLSEMAHHINREDISDLTIMTCSFIKSSTRLPTIIISKNTFQLPRINSLGSRD